MCNSYQPITRRGMVVVRSDKPPLFIYQLTLIIIVSILLYLYTVGNNFVYDDTFTVVNNYLIRRGTGYPRSLPAIISQPLANSVIAPSLR